MKPIHKKKKKKKAEKENVSLATKVNHHNVSSRLLTLVHSEVTKPSNYTPYFTD